jgi:putative hydrolase of the HAD superfamily
MSIQTIIFDFGNVIGFFDHGRATRRLERETGLPAAHWHRLMMDAALEEEYESGRVDSQGFLRRVRESCGIEVPESLLAEAYGDIFWPNTDVCLLVPKLKGRYRLLLGSNTTELHARQFRRQFADTLGHLDGIVLSFEIGARKPKAAFFQHCQRLAGCASEECVFIDDLPSNIEGARACGLQGIVYIDAKDLTERLACLGVTV